MKPFDEIRVHSLKTVEMYYKVTNKDSEVYKELHKMRSEELEMEELNRKLIDNAVGLEFDRYLGHRGQQNMSRVSQYQGFEFTEPDNVCMKTWKRHKIHESFFVPNRKTKLGRDMSDFLRKTCSGSWFERPLKILGLEFLSGPFSFPYVEIFGDVIIIYLDDKYDPKLDDVIEITSKEFNEIFDKNK